MKNLKTIWFLAIGEVLLTNILAWLFDFFMEGGIDFVFSVPIVVLIVSVLVAIGLLLMGNCTAKIDGLQHENAELKQKNTCLLQKTVNGQMQKVTEGDVFFHMALSQPMGTPLQTELLKHALENHNVYASLLLGNLYQSTAKKEYEKAVSVYKSIREYDFTGVSDWMIGRLYEKNLVAEAQIVDESTRLQQAKEYYLLSKTKNYPKALNSLGKFHYYGWGGCSNDRLEALKYYKDAADRHDIFGCLNCGHSEMKFYMENKNKEHLYNARTYFIKAAQYNNPEGWVQLGITYEECKEFVKAKQCYLHSVKFGSNPYVATGYYKLGCLMNHGNLSKKDSDVRELLNCTGDTNYAVECFKRSYEIYRDSLQDGLSITGDYFTCYSTLVEAFETIQ